VKTGAKLFPFGKDGHMPFQHLRFLGYVNASTLFNGNQEDLDQLGGGFVGIKGAKVVLNLLVLSRQIL